MKSRRNPKLGEFVDEVRHEVTRQEHFQRDVPTDAPIAITKENAVAAADYIDARLSAASKGGKVERKTRTGRPITNKSHKAALNRARVRRHREKKSVE